MGALQNYFVQLHYFECPNCGIPHGISDQLYRSANEQGVSWVCPKGHRMQFTESLKQKMEKELAQEKQRREWAETNARLARERADRQERKTRAFKGILTKTKKRVGNGVCPCCNRTFQNLMNHMNLEHPQYKGKK